MVSTAHADVVVAVKAIKLGAVDPLEQTFKDDAPIAAVCEASNRCNAEQRRITETQVQKFGW